MGAVDLSPRSRWMRCHDSGNRRTMLKWLWSGARAEGRGVRVRAVGRRTRPDQCQGD